MGNTKFSAFFNAMDESIKTNGTINIGKEILRYIRGINDNNYEDYIHVDINGVDVDVMPYIVNATSYFDAGFKWGLYKYDDSEIDFEPVNLSEKELIDNYYMLVMSSMLPYDYNNNNMRYYIMHEFNKHKASVVRELFMFYGGITLYGVNVLFDSKDSILSDIKCNIVDTATLSLCISMYWLLTKLSSLNRHIDKKYRVNFWLERINHFLQDKSLFKRYFYGEISARKMHLSYISGIYSDRISIMEKEYYMCHNLDKLSKLKDVNRHLKNIKLSNFEQSIFKYYYDNELNDINSSINHHISIALRMNDKAEAIVKELKDCKEESIKKSAEIDELNRKYNFERTKQGNLKATITELKKRVDELESKLRNKPVKIESSNNEVKELQNSLKSIKADLDESIKEELSVRQENASLKKQVKKLQALVKNNEEIEDIDVDDDIEQVSIEEAIDFIKDKRVVLIGGDDKSHWEDTFNKYGLDKFIRINNQNVVWTKLSGKYDLIVYLYEYLGHSLFYKARKFLRTTKTMYFKGNNSERFILEVYDMLNGDKQ